MAEDGAVEPELVEALEARQVDDLVALYRQAWWAGGRERNDVERMLAGSAVVLGALDPESGRLVGFTRALSDGVFKALVFDVLVDEAWRGRGLGRRLMRRVLEHPRLRDVRHVELYCLPDRVRFYEHLGFAPDASGTVFLRRAGGGS